MIMTRALKLFLQPNTTAEFSKYAMSKFWTTEQRLGTLHSTLLRYRGNCIGIKAD